MSQLEFRRLRGEYWDSSFTSSFGILATKLYRELYKKAPKKRYSRRANRNSVNLYPCGILEQAYRQLRAKVFRWLSRGAPWCANWSAKRRNTEIEIKTRRSIHDTALAKP
jgi:hypothetical protein